MKSYHYSDSELESSITTKLVFLYIRRYEDLYKNYNQEDKQQLDSIVRVLSDRDFSERLNYYNKLKGNVNPNLNGILEHYKTHILD